MPMLTILSTAKNMMAEIWQNYQKLPLDHFWYINIQDYYFLFQGILMRVLENLARMNEQDSENAVSNNVNNNNSDERADSLNDMDEESVRHLVI